MRSRGSIGPTDHDRSAVFAPPIRVACHLDRVGFFRPPSGEPLAPLHERAYANKAANQGTRKIDLLL